MALSLSLYLLSRKHKVPPPPALQAVISNPPSLITVTSETTLPDIELTSLSSEYNPLPVPAVQRRSGYWYPSATPPHCPCPPNGNPCPPNGNPCPPNGSVALSALVLYSPYTPKNEKEDILGTLVVGLRHYGINAKSPDTCVDSANISVWLEKEVTDSTVLLVCNQALKRDWDNERSSKLVCALKQLLHGSVVDKGLANFATVLMSGYGSSCHIPSPYLVAQKQFTVDSFEDIAPVSHFVLKVPLYQPAC